MIYSKRHKVSLFTAAQEKSRKVFTVDVGDILSTEVQKYLDAVQAEMSAPTYTQDQVDELQRCQNDPKYFISKYVKVMNPLTGEVPFVLHSHQEDLIDHITEFKRVICLQGRQVGISSSTIAYLLWDAMFQFHGCSLHLSPRLANAKDAAWTFEKMYESLPKWLRAECTVRRQTSFEFASGARVQFEPLTSKSGRGRSLTTLVLADFANTDAQTAHMAWEALAPCVSVSSTKLLVHSSVGPNRLFTDLYEDATLGESFMKDLKINCIDSHQTPQNLIDVRTMIGDAAFREQYLCEW